MNRLIYAVLFLGLMLVFSCSSSDSKDDGSSGGTPISTITIGSQTWTSKNLDVSTYRNGDPIPQVQDPAVWRTLTTGAWCYYENNTANGVVYGKLYNWYALTDSRGIAPEGFHIPTDAEWDELTTSLGGENVAGGKMKEAGTAHWSAPNTDATNSSGFTALPGGARLTVEGSEELTFGAISTDAGWWSVTENNDESVKIRHLWHDRGGIENTSISKFFGLAVRCVKNSATTLPVVATGTIFSEGDGSSLTCGGNISFDGGSSVTARGIVWSTSPSPTIALPTKTVNGSGVGSFSGSITGLGNNSTYYVRAYATNSAGTAYGAQKSYARYNLVTLGSQRWMLKNLDVSFYTDGTPIPQVQDPGEWVNLTTGAWCYYENDSANGPIYGKLYNWYAVAGIHNNESLNNESKRKKLAPQGFHIPTSTEWDTLIDFLGGPSVAGGKLKSTAGWNAPNEGASNSSGFTGLPSGFRYGYEATIDLGQGAFTSIGDSCSWWSSTLYDPDKALSSSLYYNYVVADTGPIGKRNGISVRCIKD